MRIDDFLKQQLRLSDRTKEGYRKDLRAFQTFTKCDEPSMESVSSYVDELRRRVRTSSHISRVLYAIRRYCRWIGIDQQVFGQGKIEIPGFEFKQQRSAISDEAAIRLINAGRTPLEIALPLLLFGTGMRIVEAQRLDVDDIDWGTGKAMITRKGRRERKEEIIIHPTVLAPLKEYRDWAKIRKGPLFPQPYNELRNWFKAQAKRAKVEFPKYSLMHNLRHGFVISRMRRGIKIEDISEAVGHSSINTTLKIYGRRPPEELWDAMGDPFAECE